VQYVLWSCTFLVPGCIALLVILAAVRRNPSVESVPLLLAHLVSVIGMFYTAYRNEQPEFGGLQPTWVHMVPLLLVMGWIVTRRFAGSLKAAEASNVELAQRVEAKRIELEANYRRLGELEKEQAVVAERARLMSDMHDGIGGQLISTLSLVEHGETSKNEVAAALRECIDDLRLAIDSLEPSDDDLLPVLGNLRYRLEPRLRARGIELDWQIRDVPKLACLTPQNVLHVLRILQEAFTNVLKHAQARVVRVATSVSEHGVSIDVCDDGRGFDEHVGSQGHGLGSMQQRAQAVGGALSLRTSPAGTTLSLLLPAG
jgi:signal transduction histidine kinase